MERHGRLDVLVNAAGTARAERVDDVSREAFDAQVALNLGATVAVCTAALPALRASRGLIVNVASILGLQGDPALAVYSATKHAIVGYSRSLAEALRGDGVRVTALCPGYVATPFTAAVQGRVSADEMVQPGDCARAVRMLLELSPQTFVPELVLDRLGSVGPRLRL
jgi:NAD(P)-dependent dehydrogenase (short-subunit alcohol dehydrogenase family)